MATEYPYIDISQAPELQRLADEVRKTRRPQTRRLADGVVAVVKPEKHAGPRKGKARLGRVALSPMTLEEVFGSVPTPPHLRGKDIDEMIREAKDEHADRIMRHS